MGRIKGLYEAEFPPGTVVRVRNREALERFVREWQWHNPLQGEQLKFAGYAATVKSVGFYHGGDELYELDAVPGIWHEECLEPYLEE